MPVGSDKGNVSLSLLESNLSLGIEGPMVATVDGGGSGGEPRVPGVGGGGMLGGFGSAGRLTRARDFIFATDWDWPYVGRCCCGVSSGPPL